jgi:hypothetical protein
MFPMSAVTLTTLRHAVDKRRYPLDRGANQGAVQAVADVAAVRAREVEQAEPIGHGHGQQQGGAKWEWLVVKSHGAQPVDDVLAPTAIEHDVSRSTLAWRRRHQPGFNESGDDSIPYAVSEAPGEPQVHLLDNPVDAGAAYCEHQGSGSEYRRSSRPAARRNEGDGDAARVIVSRASVATEHEVGNEKSGEAESEVTIGAATGTSCVLLDGYEGQLFGHQQIPHHDRPPLSRVIHDVLAC